MDDGIVTASVQCGIGAGVAADGMDDAIVMRVRRTASELALRRLAWTTGSSRHRCSAASVRVLPRTACACVAAVGMDDGIVTASAQCGIGACVAADGMDDTIVMRVRWTALAQRRYGWPGRRGRHACLEVRGATEA
eukprot:NODE_4399_length_678_cov_251.452648.p3 GENE.NODE_4399_length_678_cov_251.452648~~NODE_4399_length_678_cov_251.452648.p3  ORF type:complete len:136 (+),score=23.06 NODE_4399_length_678_cov_251.452648:153-560(+)